MFINLQIRVRHQSTALSTDVSLLANYSGQPKLPLPPQPAVTALLCHTLQPNIRVNINFMTVIISQPSFLTECHNCGRRDPFLTFVVLCSMCVFMKREASCNFTSCCFFIFNFFLPFISVRFLSCFLLFLIHICIRMKNIFL